MIIEKKLIALSVLSIIIGVAFVSPLPLVMSEKVQTTLYDQPQFNMDLQYAFVGDYWNNDSILANQSYGWIYALAYRAYPTFDVKTMPADAEFEYYTIELWSENGLVGNLTCSTTARRTNFNVSVLKSTSSYTFNPDKFFDVNSSSRWAAGLSGSENGTTQGFIVGPQKYLNQALGEPETLNVTVRRIGWVIVDGDSAVAHLADSKPILQIQLEKYDDGFIYNNLFTEEQLSEINPVMPQYELCALQGGHPVDKNSTLPGPITP